MAGPGGYNDLQKEVSSAISEFEERFEDVDDREEDASSHKAVIIRNPRAYFNSYSGDDNYNSHHREPLLARATSPPLRDLDHQPSPTRASKMFSKACGCFNRICHRPRRRSVSPTFLAFSGLKV
ncbi:hypothetical protein PG996_003771 [Apiospora saccharicola]|uniref:Uncharacterized protein n=1 Tax=Apiospora saccharicola TaxID=335842 RepID=A0ABR1W4Y6_9PEZI